jgi:CheY-like chemotaxis protein/ribosome-associated translation inhibitor RaiA
MQSQYDSQMHPAPAEATTAVRTKSILLAEDDHEMRVLLEQRLKQEGYVVESCGDGFQLLQHIGSFSRDDLESNFDLVVSDIRMPGFTGLEILDFIHENGGFPPAVLITAFGDEDTHAEAERLGVAAVLDKPFDLDHLMAVVERVLAAEDDQAIDDFEEEEEDAFEGHLPIEIVFRRFPRTLDLEEHIRATARIFEPFRDDILYFRVIVSLDRGRLDPQHIELRAIITVPGKVFVASNSRSSREEESDIYSATSEVFSILEGRLRKYYEKFPPIKHHRTGHA